MLLFYGNVLIIKKIVLCRNIFYLRRGGVDIQSKKRSLLMTKMRGCNQDGRFVTNGLAVAVDEKIIDEHGGDLFQIVGIERKMINKELIPTRLKVFSMESGRVEFYPVGKFKYYKPERAIDAPGILATCA